MVNRSTGQRVNNSGDSLDGIIIAGQNSRFGKKIAPDQTNLLGPRLDFAWDATGKQKTVIRSGFGVFYTRILIGSFINNAFDNAPFNRSITILSPEFNDPTGGTLNPDPAASLTAMSTDLKAHTTYQWFPPPPNPPAATGRM